jgi:predicted chitinase
MLISYPILPSQVNAAEAENQYEDNSFSSAHEHFDEGVYPVSFDNRWHGGIHLKPASNTEPIRAIADGVIVAYRFATTPLYTHTDTNKTQPCDNGFVLIKHKTESGEGVAVEYYSLYMHLANEESNKKQTLVLIQDKAADCMRKAKAVAPDAKASTPAAADKKVYRKQILGYPGQMYGERIVHFEIFTDEAKLNAFFKDSKVDYVDANKDGSKELWGDVYFVIPSATKFVKKNPSTKLHEFLNAQNEHVKMAGGTVVKDDPKTKANESKDAEGNTKYSGGYLLKELTEGESDKKLYVGWHYTKGQRTMTLWEDGNPEPILNSATCAGELNYEYDLHQLANVLYATCPSAGYELLRWGRMMGPDKDKLNTDALKENWQPTPYKNKAGQVVWGYTNLSDSKILKLSDADFPHWLGWKKVPSASKSDGTIDISKLKEVFKDIDTNNDNNISKEELTAWLKDAKGKRKFKHLVVQSPSEWDKAHNTARYSNLKDAGQPFDPAKDAGGKNWTEFNAFIEKFQWWTDAGLGASNVWHFHPIQFIQQYKGCGWIDKEALARIYKDTPEATREKYRLALNRMLQKYIFISPIRQSHLFGQGANESASLKTMVEKSQEQIIKDGVQKGGGIVAASATPESDLGHWYGSIPSEVDTYYSGEKYNSKGGRITGSYSWVLGNCGDTDAQKFRGRGFKQLTGRSNYSKYWVYRGWLKKTDFDDSWWDDPQWKAKNAAGMKKTPAPINNPELVVTDPINCMDSGGYYLNFERPKVKKSIDDDALVTYEVKAAKGQPDEAVVLAVTKAINGGDIGYPDRLTRTRQAKIILLDSTSLIHFD